MKEYLRLLKTVKENGRMVPTRAVLASTGKNVHALSVFGAQAGFELTKGFPLLTTKKIPFRLIVAELLWFLRGETNVRSLQEQNCHIWDQWAAENGELGPVYGSQWRNWTHGYPMPHVERIDQIETLLENLLTCYRDPFHSSNRRLIVSAWNVADLPKMALVPCHFVFQFRLWPKTKQLDCHVNMRSADLFLGVPFNIASYALLTHLVADVVNSRNEGATQPVTPGDLVVTFGDLHVYENHLDQINEQLTREPRPLPRLEIQALRNKLEEYRPDDVKLVDYDPWPTIKGEVAV